MPTTARASVIKYPSFVINMKDIGWWNKQPLSLLIDYWKIHDRDACLQMHSGWLLAGDSRLRNLGCVISLGKSGRWAVTEYAWLQWCVSTTIAIMNTCGYCNDSWFRQFKSTVQATRFERMARTRRFMVDIIMLPTGAEHVLVLCLSDYIIARRIVLLQLKLSRRWGLGPTLNSLAPV